MIAFWIILTGALIAMSSGILGCFLVLRKLSMLGDAISHAVLPGIVIAVFLSGGRESLSMLIGAAFFGLLTTLLIEFLQKKAHIKSDSAIGVIFTFLFAIGIILISYYGGRIDVDQDCVLYGEIAYVPIDQWILSNGWIMGPRSVYILGGLFLLVIGFVGFFFKELSITAFDPEYADSIGISTTLWHYMLMILVSLTTVVSFESVGAILIINFMVGPPVMAFLLTDNLKKMLWISGVIGIIIAVLGYIPAVVFDVSIAGSMACMTGFLFLLVVWRGRRRARVLLQARGQQVSLP